MDNYKSLVDPSWELTDPNPDIFAMFVEFNREFFWNQLGGVEVKWSKRMTVCAGLCRYTGRMGLCSVVLSEPLLKLRPRKDLVQTLLHEMIHAYLFVTDNFRDHDAHGPKFVSHMERINRLTGTHITIYHSFHQEVRHYKVHWWKCDGPCQSRPPFHGIVKRSMNRKPGPNDFWFAEHQRTCGGNFIKIREPEPTDPSLKSKKQTSAKESAAVSAAAHSHKINEYFKPINAPGTSSSSTASSSGASRNIQSSSTATSANPIPSTSSGARGTVKPKNTSKKKSSKKENKTGGGKKPTPSSGTSAKPKMAGGGGTSMIFGGRSTTTTTIVSKKKTTSGTVGSTNSSFTPFTGQGHVLGSSGSGIPPYKQARYS